jgi:hypothetical protein
MISNSSKMHLITNSIQVRKTVNFNVIKIKILCTTNDTLEDEKITHRLADSIF